MIFVIVQTRHQLRNGDPCFVSYTGQRGGGAPAGGRVLALQLLLPVVQGLAIVNRISGAANGKKNQNR